MRFSLRVCYLVCFLVFHDTAIIHGLFSVGLRRQNKKSGTKQNLFWNIGASRRSRVWLTKSYCCPQDDKTVWFSVLLLEFEHISEREGRADIGIHNEKGLWTSSYNLVPEVINATSGAQSWILLQVPAAQQHIHTWFGNWNWELKSNSIIKKLDSS